MTTVLFIHGFPFDHSQWRHQVGAVPGWRCIAPDLPGAGVTRGFDSTDDYSVASYATHLIGILDQAEVGQAVICGLSMGGYIAFELLRRVPDRVRAAVLSNTKATPDTAEAKRGRDLLAAKAQKEGAPAVAKELVPKLVVQPEVVGEVTAMIERQPVAGIVGALRALRERPDSTPLLATLRIPVLVVAGADDRIAPAEGMQQMAHAIPGARFVVIPRSGHLTPLEQPRAFNAELGAFL
ncbi:MAG: alpha/beta fold hydrolase [Gemmatimonadota bacterium]